jgi:hypothetical protein
MRREQQKTGGLLNCGLFKQKVADTAITLAQLGRLQQRLDTLKSFMPDAQTRNLGNKKGNNVLVNSGND